MIKSTAINYLKHIGFETGKKREEAIQSLLPAQENASYLDLGCGDGGLTIARAEKIRTKKIFGIEILDSEIKKAKSRKIIVKKGDLNNKFPFNSEMFDVVTATQVIEHLYEVDLFISEIKRVLKKNGLLIISTENLSAWHNIFALFIGLQPSAGPFISRRFSIGFHPLAKEHKEEHVIKPYLAQMEGHTRVMAYHSFRKLFERYGFEIVSEKTIGYYPFPSPVADVLASIDKWHALDVILKVRKV